MKSLLTVRVFLKCHLYITCLLNCCKITTAIFMHLWSLGSGLAPGRPQKAAQTGSSVLLSCVSIGAHPTLSYFHLYIASFGTGFIGMACGDTDCVSRIHCFI